MRVIATTTLVGALAGSLVAGCAGNPWFAAESRVRRGEELARLARYGEAKDAYEQALTDAPSPQAARRALLGLVRIYLLAEYPHRDYARAGEYFERLATDASGAVSVAEALAWRDLLAAVASQRRRLDESRREAERLRQDAQRLRQDLERLKQLESELARLRSY